MRDLFSSPVMLILAAAVTTAQAGEWGPAMAAQPAASIVRPTVAEVIWTSGSATQLDLAVKQGVAITDWTLTGSASRFA